MSEGLRPQEETAVSNQKSEPKGFSFDQLFFSMPILLAAAGLACVLTSLQGMRIATLIGIYPVEISLVARHVVAVAVAIMLVAYALRNPETPLFRNATTYIVVACLLALSILAKYQNALFGTSAFTLELIGRLCEESLEGVLFFCWGAVIIPRGLRVTASVLTSAIILSAGLQFLLSSLQKAPCMVVLIIVPLISAALFAACRHFGAQEPDAAPQFAGVAPLNQGQSLGLFAGLIVCLSFILGSIIFESLDAQNAMSDSPIAQLCIIAGNLLGGLIMAYFSPRIRNPIMLMVFLLFSLACCSLALYMTTFVSAEAVGTYLTVSSIGVQATTVLVWCSPFILMPSFKRAMACFGTMYLAFFFGKVISSTCMVTSVSTGLPVHNFAVSFALVMVLVFGSMLAFKLTGERTAVPSLKGEQVTDEAADGTIDDGAAPSEAPAPQPRAYFREAVESLSHTHRLTPSEARVFALLARGSNAGAIAEELTLSVNTVKSHMRNAYAKLGVHSQQEIIALVNQRKAELVEENEAASSSADEPSP